MFAIGSIGYDFGTEARRDSFTQLMPYGQNNPHNPEHLVNYLSENLHEARSVIWVVYMELTPIYAIEPFGSFSRDTYQRLVDLLKGQIKTDEDGDYIERISIPGVLSGRSVKLFSGQVIPVIETGSPRGVFGWKINSLIDDAVQATQDSAGDGGETPDEENLRSTLRGFLNRVFYDLRNLGATSPDRALNYAVTNAFQVASAYSDALINRMELDNVFVEKSPFCRMDSDCWDVKLKFFDPENNKRAKRVYRFTVDVSDTIPVLVGDVRAWTTSD